MAIASDLRRIRLGIPPEPSGLEQASLALSPSDPVIVARLHARKILLIVLSLYRYETVHGSRRISDQASLLFE